MKEKSRYLSMLLRHTPERENLKLDQFGWCNVNILLEKLSLTREELDKIVEQSDKKRFRYNENKNKIKANQGHSIPIEHDFKRVRPPAVLYHGTTIDKKKIIQKTGLKKMKRHHVHLSDNLDTAKRVGMRYAKYENKLVILHIDSGKMNRDGYKFFVSPNGIYLINHVPPSYLKF